MKKYLCLLALTLLVTSTQGQKPEETEDWSRKPSIVTPGKLNQPPSDAIVLYNRKEDLDKWVQENGEPARWLADTNLTVAEKTGSIKTNIAFGDVQLHVEWRTPGEVKGNGQGRGNSGVFLMGKYEVQVLDSYDNETYYNEKRLHDA